MTENPEKAVIDAIDELVNESLARPITDDYCKPWDARCTLCHGEWHGLPAYGCPGAYATDDQKQAYQQRTHGTRTHHTYYEAFEHGTAVVNDQALEGYTHIGYVDQIESVHISQDRPAFPNIESQSGTTEYTTSWTITYA